MEKKHFNHRGQPVGKPLPYWVPASPPVRQTITGSYCRLAPLDPERHSRDLFEAYALDSEGRNWTYLPYGPFENLTDYRHWLMKITAAADPFFYAILDPLTEKPAGVFAMMAIDQNNGSAEIGHVNFSPLLQRTRAATEATYLLIRTIFDLGYRRCEWKCASLNEASGRAARRYGFKFEGRFRQHRVAKGHNRDTDWYSIIDEEWPLLEQAFKRWLDPRNFDSQGKEAISLSKLVEEMTPRP